MTVQALLLKTVVLRISYVYLCTCSTRDSKYSKRTGDPPQAVGLALVACGRKRQRSGDDTTTWRNYHHPLCTRV
jgi:hypothetical protein